MQLKKKVFTGSTSDRVTERELENRKLARKVAAEGFVLLKNEAHTLPLAKDSKIGLYGAGAVRTIKGGTGSGDVNERDCVTIYQGLKQAGYEITSESWLEHYSTLYVQARLDWKETILRKSKEAFGETAILTDFFSVYSNTPFQMPCGSSIDVGAAKEDGATTAIFVLSRIAGENADRHDVEGDYRITKEETALLTQLGEAYQHIILVINTGGLMDLSFVEEVPNIKAILQFVQAGQEGGNAFADVISGEVTPSGKLADSWANAYGDYPNAQVFSHNNGNTDTERYEEGIYVGYRYFDTFDIPVRYCFGYGLSYTEFTIDVSGLTAAGTETTSPRIEVAASVKNAGDVFSGKEVVQAYASCPQGKLPKEYRRLAGFGKTKLLRPGETQNIKISFPLYQLASYSEEKAAWILEAGTYGIWVGNSIATAELVGVICLDEEAVMVQCRHICECKEKLTELVSDAIKMKEKEAAWQKRAEELAIPQVSIRAAQVKHKKISYSRTPGKTLGKAEEIVNSLSEDQLIALVTGDPGKGQGNMIGSAGITVPGAAGETSSVAAGEPWKVASIVLADGPAGLRLNKTYQVENGEIQPADPMTSFDGGFFSPPLAKTGTTYYQFCTSIPVGTLLAQTWNTGLIKETGEMIGHELELFHITLWLAPGMNIHRNPLCGRNFEYYSEDPLLSGMMASAMTLGVQKIPGCGTTIKHFACNNQEDNRSGSDSVLSERALREIYLKGFEIAVMTAQPMAIMTSYNMINGVHAANNNDLCIKAARDEWAFKGAIVTDWTTTTTSARGVCTAAGCIRAGHDMIMPGDPMDHENIRQELKEGTLDISELKRSICNMVNLSLQSNQYEGAPSYLAQFENLVTWNSNY